MVDIKWQEVVEGSGVFLHSYEYEKFGPANSVLAELRPGAYALLSPPPFPTSQSKAEVAAKGELEALVITNIAHTAGFADWLTEFPEAKLFAPATAIPLLSRSHPHHELLPLENMTHSEKMIFVDGDGARSGATLLRSDQGKRPVVFVDELVINLTRPVRPLFMRLVFKLTGTGLGPTINKAYSMLLSDKKGAKDQLLALLKGNPVCIPAHGDTMEARVVRDLLQR